MCNKENYKVAAYMKLNFGTNDLSKVEKDVKFFRDGFKRYLKMNMELDTVEFYIDNIDSNCAFEKMIKEGFEYKYPNGESLIDTFHRIKNQIDIILEQNESKSILICSHGGTIRNIISYLLCNDYKYHWNFRVDNGSITEIEVNNNFAVINKMNDTTYFKL